jgi:flagellar basal body rod protein FlgB
MDKSFKLNEDEISELETLVFRAKKIGLFKTVLENVGDYLVEITTDINHFEVTIYFDDKSKKYTCLMHPNNVVTEVSQFIENHRRFQMQIDKIKKSIWEVHRDYTDKMLNINTFNGEFLISISKFYNGKNGKDYDNNKLVVKIEKVERWRDSKDYHLLHYEIFPHVIVASDDIPHIIERFVYGDSLN